MKPVRKATNKVLDVHLMIAEPEKYVKRFVEAGANYVTFHHEACADPRRAIAEIKAAGAKAGVSIKPATPAEAVFDYLSELDMVLVMSVEPGFGGQSFMIDSLDKVRALRKEIDEKIQQVKNLPPSRERSLAVTKLQEAVMWLGMDLKRLGEKNPYPSSKDPETGTQIEPTADGLKL
jgi:hypothetical protein